MIDHYILCLAVVYGVNMDINGLLNNFFGNQNNSNDSNTAQTGSGAFDISSLAEKAKGLTQKATQGGVNSFAGGAVAGGLLSLLLSNGKARDIAGGALGYGGAALLGALAHNAYQNYQAGKKPEGSVNTLLESQPNVNDYSINGDQNFGIVLIKGMIAAAKSDGHIDSAEQNKIFSEIEKMNLPADQKALIFDSLMKPIDLNELTKNIHSMEQAAEFYLASCLAIEPNQTEEKRYLESLGTMLKLPPELIEHIHVQIKSIQSNK